jgi:hypothetical protein
MSIENSQYFTYGQRLRGLIVSQAPGSMNPSKAKAFALDLGIKDRDMQRAISEILSREVVCTALMSLVNGEDLDLQEKILTESRRLYTNKITARLSAFLAGLFGADEVFDPARFISHNNEMLAAQQASSNNQNIVEDKSQELFVVVVLGTLGLLLILWVTTNLYTTRPSSLPINTHERKY